MKPEKTVGPKMRDFVLLICSSSSSSSSSPSIYSPPNPNPNPNRHCRSTKLSPSTPPPRSSPLSAAASRSRPLSALRFDPSSASSSRSRLRYFAEFAARLARDGKLDDFAMILESLIVSGADASRLAAALRSDFAEKGVSDLVRGGEARGFAAVLGKLDELGFSPVEMFGGSAAEVLRRECRRILKCELLEEFVELVEVLAGFGFSIKELVKPPDVIKICVEKRQPKLAIRYACTLPHSHMLFCDTVNEFGKKRDLASALTAYEAAKKNSSTVNMYLYRAIIDVCGRCHDYMKSRHIYEELRSQKVTANVYVFNSLMNTNASDLNYTLNTYRDMQNLGVQADMASYNIILKACCLAGRVDLAQNIYKEVQHLESTGVLKLDVFTYSTIVKVFADAKLWHMALRVKDDMLKAGVTPNTVTWSSLISACANAGIVEKALLLFEEMLLAGCEPNTQCCNILLHACVEACQYDRAFRLFDWWKRNTAQENSEEDGDGNIDSNITNRVTGISPSSNLYCLTLAKDLPFTPTAATYNILIKACGSDYYHAKGLMEEMKTVGLSPNHITWSILIDICGSLRNVEGAQQILKTMRATGIEPDVVAYTTVIKVCVENNDLKLAFELFAEMKAYQIQPNLVTYNTLLRARSRYGSLQEVKQCLAVYQDMRRAGYNSNDYYLKQLIEEWCEGVIQGNSLKQVEDKSYYYNVDKERPESFLLEKVAEHLQMHISESLAVNLQGLTKVEARILVLAVLRMVKENYFIGQMVKGDMFIVLGVNDDGREVEVKQAITKLLQDELGLEVLQSGLKIASSNDRLNSQNQGTKESPPKTVYSTRRPMVVLQRLKVTKKSLQKWLQRKNFIS